MPLESCRCAPPYRKITAKLNIVCQAKPFREDDIQDAEARLQVRLLDAEGVFVTCNFQTWISSFADEASRRDSLLQVHAGHREFVV